MTRRIFLEFKTLGQLSNSFNSSSQGCGRWMLLLLYFAYWLVNWFLEVNFFEVVRFKLLTRVFFFLSRTNSKAAISLQSECQIKLHFPLPLFLHSSHYLQHFLWLVDWEYFRGSELVVRMIFNLNEFHRNYVHDGNHLIRYVEVTIYLEYN